MVVAASGAGSAGASPAAPMPVAAAAPPAASSVGPGAAMASAAPAPVAPVAAAASGAAGGAAASPVAPKPASAVASSTATGVHVTPAAPVPAAAIASGAGSAAASSVAPMPVAAVTPSASAPMSPVAVAASGAAGDAAAASKPAAAEVSESASSDERGATPSVMPPQIQRLAYAVSSDDEAARGAAPGQKPRPVVPQSPRYLQPCAASGSGSLSTSQRVKLGAGCPLAYRRPPPGVDVRGLPITPPRRLTASTGQIGAIRCSPFRPPLQGHVSIRSATAQSACMAPAAGQENVAPAESGLSSAVAAAVAAMPAAAPPVASKSIGPPAVAAGKPPESQAGNALRH